MKERQPGVTRANASQSSPNCDKGGRPLRGPTIACVRTALARIPDAHRRPARWMNASQVSSAAQSNCRFCRSLGWLLADTGPRRSEWAREILAPAQPPQLLRLP